VRVVTVQFLVCRSVQRRPAGGGGEKWWQGDGEKWWQGDGVGGMRRQGRLVGWWINRGGDGKYFFSINFVMKDKPRKFFTFFGAGKFQMSVLTRTVTPP
jgi:hypothetical protein